MPTGIAILDFGGQYAHLIANRIRRLRVYAEIFPPHVDPTSLRGVSGLILSGGPASVYDPDPPAFNPEVLDMPVPILGLCYGHQLLCVQMGGEVVPGDVREYGSATLHVAGESALFAGIDDALEVWMSHGDVVATLPDGFEILGTTEDCPVAVIGDVQRHIYGLQFHPEVAHTPRGLDIFDNFLTICNAARTWTMGHYADVLMADLRAQVGERNVFLLVSGGVDSSVAFVLCNRALGADRVLGLHIDNGFMRAHETAAVKTFLQKEGFDNLMVKDASDDFLLSVEGLTDPEAKREAIGRTFLAVKDDVMAKLHLNAEDWVLAQGTLYPDTIESGGSTHAALIKTHHNRIGMIDELIAQGKIVEPLAQLYKDEVRELGRELGLPDHLIWRHPFPGPGLAVRCLCSDGRGPKDEVTVAERAASAIAAKAGLHLQILPVKSVGVQGDFRTYSHPALVAGPADWAVLEDVSTRITNSIPSINRVVYLIAPDAPPKTRLKRAFPTRQRLDLLRRADAIAMRALEQAGLMASVSQMPTVLAPVTTDGWDEIAILRPITTPDFMTARFAALPRDLVREIAAAILKLPGIAAVCYDITHKPPGTVEWE